MTKETALIFFKVDAMDRKLTHMTARIGALERFLVDRGVIGEGDVTRFAREYEVSLTMYKQDHPAAKELDRLYREMENLKQQATQALENEEPEGST